MVKTLIKEKKVRQEEDLPPPISTIDANVVLQNVLQQLGKPKNMCAIGPGLTRATACCARSFRVQIYCKPGDVFGAAPVLTDSFWVKVNGLGDITNSNPQIIRKY